METKKTWEYVSLALIPTIRLSHCPLRRISNVKPAHASDDISRHHGADSQGNENENDNDNLNGNDNEYANDNQSIYAKRVHLETGYTLLYI